jgi:hypothetical protein
MVFKLFYSFIFHPPNPTAVREMFLTTVMRWYHENPRGLSIEAFLSVVRKQISGI